MSTNSKGPRQPGCMKVSWSLEPINLQPVEGIRGESERVLQIHEPVADFIVYSSQNSMFTVVAEVKSGEEGVQGLDQNIEQMLGVWSEGQALMLGLVLDACQVY